MLIDAERFEAEYAKEGILPNDDDERETMKERIEWAIDMVKEQRDDSKFLVDYFETALTEVSLFLIPSFFFPLSFRFHFDIIINTHSLSSSNSAPSNKTKWPS